MIKLEGISKKFGDSTALENVSLDIKRGEFVALLGPSGCGKSTTLMILAGLLQPTSGKVYFDGKIVNHVEPKDRDIGMVFQSYALYPHMSVLDNIAFPLKQRKVKKKERYQKAQEIAAMLQIDQLTERMPSQLSGGQQQRVAMARALAKDPLFLLLDEPMSNLDARLKVDVRDEIRRLQLKLGITTIIVTHDQEEAMAVADKIAILQNGKIQQYGTPDELFMKPVNLFVAHFMGNPPMNILKCDLLRNGNERILRGDGFDYKLLSTKKLNAEFKGTKVALGARPHHLQISKVQLENSIPAKVVLVEQLGREKLIKVMLGDNENTTNFIRILSPSDLNVSYNERVYLTLDSEAIHIFDEQTGKVIT
ncbi:ABC transporter ATP-binding protein [Paenibacillus sp. IHBB 3054]|uniref:ABC transporter ATP-binding protein n=1 Tax=Paenibacillus sp. IHBB 3054 TaxID=3425689 RepID=UPI003F677688